VFKLLIVRIDDVAMMWQLFCKKMMLVCFFRCFGSTVEAKNGTGVEKQLVAGQKKLAGLKALPGFSEQKEKQFFHLQGSWQDQADNGAGGQDLFSF
jgi:hypothetical protein